MLRDRLLTWLFITASVVVDLVLLAAARVSLDTFRYHAMLEGIALGQVGALAIWTITGQTHRLARGACLVVATGLLAVITIRDETWYFHRWLALLAVYAVIVMAVVGLISLVGHAIRNKRQLQEALRVPLMELFGWTIVVAIASFGARFMDFQVLERGLSKTSTTLAMLAVPVVAELLFRSQFQPLHWLKWLLFVGGAYAVGYYLANRRLLAIVLATQATYLAVWMVVRSLESDAPSTDEPEDRDSEEDGPTSEPRDPQ